MPTGSGNYADQIVDVIINYSFSSGGDKVWNFHVWNFADGTTALQWPYFNGGVHVTAADVDGDGISELRARVIVTNDPAGVVTNVILQLKAPGFQIPEKVVMEKESDFYGATIPVSTNPLGSTFWATATMEDAKGNQVGQSFSSEVVVQKADFTGRIRRVRIREMNNGSDVYKVIGTVEGDAKGEVASLDIKFTDATDVPLAVPNNVMAAFTRIYEENGRARYEFSPLTFEGGARPIGKTYTVKATMLGADGKPLANAVTLEVTVEGEQPATALVSSQLVSYDKGATWQMIVKLKNPLATTEYLEAEFIKPYAGPAPIESVTKLYRSGEEPDGVLVYSAPVKFEGNPLGFEYGTLICQFGSGTRTSAGQANNKAELL
jgi:hypothetical protein